MADSDALRPSAAVADDAASAGENAAASLPVERRRFVPLPYVGRLSFSMLGAVILGDWLLWGAAPGLSTGLFVGVLMLLVLVNRPREHWSVWRGLQLILIGLAAAQTVIRPGFSNFLVTCVLLVVVAGDSALFALRPLWVRWGRAGVSAVAFPVTWFVFLRSCKRRTAFWRGSYGGRLLRIVRVIAPACILLVVFMPILGSGNVMLERVLDYGYNSLLTWISELHLPDFTRFIFWAVLSTVALVLLVPRLGKWTGAHARYEVPSLPVHDPRRAVLSSTLVLGVVNALFFLTNSLDVLYLWRRQELPAGVTYAEYVHSGVWSLIAAVLLSACVMVIAFQQDASVTRSRWMKDLALLWIVQNLMLLSGVLIRLLLYVNAYWLTPRRVYVSIFLILVVVGYLLLARHVFARHSLKQLVLGNVLAVFCLFYVVQFINVPRLVAEYNYRQWLAEPKCNVTEANLDRVLGAEMIPLLVRVAESGLPVQAVKDAQNKLRFGCNYRYDDGWSLASDWRSWTLRGAQLSRTLEDYRTKVWD